MHLENIFGPYEKWLFLKSATWDGSMVLIYDFGILDGRISLLKYGIDCQRN